ncbi:integral membrane protein [Aquipluma nitroreducens]|uniref:Integral membrane protein n=1 Tax=Aquipluma nitroreducens TaxID=2010828 RepID=A0A5K7S2X9_9BACT|nr:EamA family transporter [Aquipluma nitroreducens]BBE15866.1 integral membrane protein [Aquipluma nitroreducens]
MIYLLLSILSSSVIFITFKVTERFKTNLIKLITVNYLVAAILGFSFNRHPISILNVFTSNWLPFALLIGFSFILMFFLIGYSTRLSGVAVTTIAGKLSMVIPILFSILYFSEKTTVLKISGLVLATIAVILTSYRPIDKAKNIKLIILPIAIFLGSGITDSIVKFAQTYHVPNSMSLLFSAVVFLSALILGLIFILIKPKSLSKNISIAELIGGTILGIANFGSLYFFILALNNSKLDSSVVFGLNNICIVLFSIFIGLVFFKEKFSRVNFAGVFMAVIAILILMNF